MNKLLRTIKKNGERFDNCVIYELPPHDYAIVKGIAKDGTHFASQQVNIKLHITQSQIKELEVLVEVIRKMKPTARSKHQDYCCYKKDTARDVYECDCSFSQYIKAIVDITQILQTTIKELTKD